MESPEARPVLSFLFRTCQFVARGHKRLASSRVVDPMETPEDVPVDNERTSMLRKLEATRALAIARSVCPENEIDVLLAKLSCSRCRTKTCTGWPRSRLHRRGIRLRCGPSTAIIAGKCEHDRHHITQLKKRLVSWR